MGTKFEGDEMKISSYDGFEEIVLSGFYKYLKDPKNFQPTTDFCLIKDAGENLHIYRNCYLISNGDYLFVTSNHSQDACYLLDEIEIEGNLNITKIEQKEDGSINVINPYEMKQSELNVESTSRGFKLIKFKDSNDNDCSLQESSSASENCIWFGKDDRMHLNQNMVKNLLPYLQYFSDHGFLPTSKDN